MTLGPGDAEWGQDEEEEEEVSGRILWVGGGPQTSRTHKSAGVCRPAAGRPAAAESQPRTKGRHRSRSHSG